MEFEDELSFAMGSKINIGESEWDKLVRVRQILREALETGVGDLPQLHKTCVDINTSYLGSSLSMRIMKMRA